MTNAEQQLDERLPAGWAWYGKTIAPAPTTPPFQTFVFTCALDLNPVLGNARVIWEGRVR